MSQFASQLSFPLVGNLSEKKDSGQAGATEKSKLRHYPAILMIEAQLCHYRHVPFPMK